MAKKFYLEMNIRMKGSPDSYTTNLWIGYDPGHNTYFASSLESHSMLFEYEQEPSEEMMKEIRDEIIKDVPTFYNLKDIPEFDLVLSVISMQ